MLNNKGIRRFDVGKITVVEKTPQGFLKVPGFATRTGVFPYTGVDGKIRKELRHPDDVFSPESLETLKNAPVTNEHPPEMVTPENYDQYSVGYTTDSVDVNRDLVQTTLIIAEAEAIRAVEQGGKRELSSGYLADLEEEEGVYNGVPYNYRQKNIRYNHVAIVDHGRAGPEVRLRMDSMDAIMTEEQRPMKKIIICGEEVELPANLASVVQDMMDKYDGMRGQLNDMEEKMKKDAEMAEKKDVEVDQKNISSEVPVEQMAEDGKSVGKKVDAEEEKEEKKDEDKKDAEASPFAQMKKDVEEMKKEYASKVDALQAKLDEMSSMSENKKDEDKVEGKEGKMDSVSIVVRKRVKLERNAEKVLPSTVVEKFDSMSDDEIRAAVIKHRHPKAELTGKSSVYLESRFDSIVETITQGEESRREVGSAFIRNRMDSQTGTHMDARKKMMEDTKNLWTLPLTANRK